MKYLLFSKSCQLILIVTSCSLDCSLCCLNYAGITLRSVSPKLPLVLEKIARYSYIINDIVQNLPIKGEKRCKQCEKLIYLYRKMIMMICEVFLVENTN